MSTHHLLPFIIREIRNNTSLPESNQERNAMTVVTESSQSLAIVPYVPPLDDLSAAIGDEQLDLESTEDEDVPVGAGFVYDDTLIEDINRDRFGSQRQQVELQKAMLVGTSTTVGGQCWTVRGDIDPDIGTYDDFIELGYRSSNAAFDSLPKTLRSRDQILLGTRASPRLNEKKYPTARDEPKAIHECFMTLFPVNWKQSLKRLNKAIEEQEVATRTNSKRKVSENEYWVFIGLLLLCGVQKTKGVDKLYKNPETEGMINRVNVSEFMTYTRFKHIKKHWMTQFELQVSDEYKENNKWWRVGYLVKGFNDNRKSTIASSRIKTLDESMSAYRPQTKKTGNLPNISFILRKPENLGTELKTVASTGSNGPIIFAEIQEGKDGMKDKKYFSSHGATSSCVLRLVEATKDCGQTVFADWSLTGDPVTAPAWWLSGPAA